jgi:hypothetical protein
VDAILLCFGRHPNVPVDVVRNVRCCYFCDTATSSRTSINVLDYATVDVSAKTPYCMTDVCGDVWWDILVDIYEDNDGEAGPSVADVIANTSRITCQCRPGCSSPRSERDIKDDRGDTAHIE